MIIFVAPRHQLTSLLRKQQRDARMPEWKCRTLQWLFRARRLPAATYIFIAVDRLDHGERRLGGQFYRHINSLGPGWRALNDPAVAMGRFRLLRSLHEAGINDFNAYLVAEGIRPSSFPVFIRRNGSNTPPLTGLISSQAELDTEIDLLVARGEVAEDLIIIEYCGEEYQPGIFRKLSQFRVADRYIPVPTIYAGNWMAKFATKTDVPDDWRQFDKDRFEQDDFEKVSRKVFEIAGIEYGRTDFGIVNGRPQFYEINFNPDIRTERERPNPNPTISQLRERSLTEVFKEMSLISQSGKGSKKSLSTDELLAFRLRFWRNYAPQRY